MEIVVVLAVLMLLLAIVISGVPAVLGKYASAKCASNLRHIGVGLSMYVSDHGVYPYHITGSTRWFSGSAANNSFFAGPYLGEVAVQATQHNSGLALARGGLFDCESIQAGHKEGLGPQAWIEDFFDYGQNITICGRSLGEVANPSRTVAMVEGGHYSRIRSVHGRAKNYTPQELLTPGGTQWNYGEVNGQASRVIYPHGGKANFLFLDGHVSAHEHSELDESWFDTN